MYFKAFKNILSIKISQRDILTQIAQEIFLEFSSMCKVDIFLKPMKRFRYFLSFLSL